MSSVVYCLTVYNGSLIAGGSFTTAGGGAANRIARWNGSNWQQLGSGMNGNVNALTVYNGELIAGGGFTTAGGVAADSIDRWDGSSWQPLGSGINNYVSTLTVYNGELIAGGFFATAGGVDANSIARWDGTSWQTLGSGMNKSVSALTVYNGELIAGGSFTTAGGVAANRIARWNGGSWQTLGSGMNNNVCDLTVYNGELIAGGYFTTAGGGVSAYWARCGLPEIYTGDLNHDCIVDWFDVDWFTERWLDQDCQYSGWCYEADLDRSGATDFYDYDILVQRWCANTSLVGYWKMDDDASNTTVLDSSCYGNHGTAQQNTSILHSTGIIDGALTFDGTSDYVDCDNYVSLDMADSVSISAWVRFDSFPIRQTIVAKRGALGDTGTNYALRTGSQADTDELEFYYHDGASRHVYTTSNANLIGGVWHHIVVTFTFGTGTSIQCYLNNNLLSGGWRRGDGNSAVQTNTKPVTIGGLTTGQNQRVDGAIDNVMIFNRALSTEEIEQLYQDGAN
jgi:hypothetical protein